MHIFRDTEYFGSLGIKHPTLRPTTVCERRAQGAFPSQGTEPIKTVAVMSTAPSPSLPRPETARPSLSTGPIRTPIKLGMRLMASIEHRDDFLSRRDAGPQHTATKNRRIGIDRRTLQRFAERRRRLVLLDGVAY